MEFDWKSFQNRLDNSFKEVQNRLDLNFKKLYTSRVNPDLVSGIIVNAYDSDLKLEELSNISIPSARTILIKPFDLSIMDNIVKGMQKHKPEFSPIVQSDCIKIILNPPTEETRKKSVKEAKEFLENSKVHLRNVRKDYVNELKSLKLSEDLEKKYLNQLDLEIKNMNSKLVVSFEVKEKELMSI